MLIICICVVCKISSASRDTGQESIPANVKYQLLGNLNEKCTGLPTPVNLKLYVGVGVRGRTQGL